MPTTPVAPNTDLTEVLTGILTVDGYIRLAVGRHEVPISPTFDPTVAPLTLHLAATQLQATTEPPTPLPHIQLTAPDGAHAIKAARTELVATGNRIAELLRSDQTTTPHRRQLTTTLLQLRDAHHELFGVNW